jgi:nicotinamidase-related amidase
VLTALVLVDLQTAAFDGLVIPSVHDRDVLLRNVQALLRAARTAGVPIVHIQHCARTGEVFARPSKPKGSRSAVPKDLLASIRSIRPARPPR